MEYLNWFGVNRDTMVAYFSSVDSMSILPFIRGRDFKINEMYGMKNGNETNLLRENEESFWIKKEHHIEICQLIEDDSFDNICLLDIDLDNGDSIRFSYGQLVVKLSDSELLKKCTKNILERYGIFASERIWNFVVKQYCDMPVCFVSGMEDKDISEDCLNKMKEEGERVFEENKNLLL